MKPAGQEHVDVTIRIDKEAILNVRGVTSQKWTNLTIKDHKRENNF